MDARERHLAIISGEQPDRVHVMMAEGLRSTPLGGWFPKLLARGMGLSHIVPPYRPMFFYDFWINPNLSDVLFTVQYYFDGRVQKVRYTYDTPAGSITSVVGRNPDDDLLSNSPEEFFVKQNADWRVINYIFRRMTEELRPNYKAQQLDQETMGGTGTTIAVVDKTPFQRAWVELAGVEKTVLDIADQCDEFLEFIDVQSRFHQKAAEITAGCPAAEVLIIDNVTNVISPRFYREYCLPVYQMYARAIEGSGKALAVHHDGLFRHLKKEIACAPFHILDSFTVPPTGNVSIAEARQFWPEKTLFVNLPPHLAYAGMDELHRGYESILSEWGDKRLVIEHVEDLPVDRLECHLTAALDVCGYPG